MMRIPCSCLPAIIALMSVVSAAHALQGVVRDVEDGSPLAGAAVFVEGTTVGALTDTAGAFLLPQLPSGTVRVTAALVGYRSESATVRISRDAEPEPVTFELRRAVIESSPVVVTASRRLQELRSSPAAMYVMPREGLQERNTSYVKSAIEYVPGVTAVGGQVSIRGSSGYTQGAGSRVGMMLDGVPVLTGDAEDVKWSMFPPEVVERIEVAKGPSSSLYGSGALGGAVNIITIDPGKRPETRVHLEAGLHSAPRSGYVAPPGGNRFLNVLSVTHSRMLGDTGALLSLRRYSTDGPQPGGEATRYQAFAKVSAPLDERTEVGATGLLNVEEHGQVLQSYPDSLHYTRGPGNTIIGPEQFLAAWLRRTENTRFSWSLTARFFRSAFEEKTSGGEFVWDSDSGTLGVEFDATWLVVSGLTATFGMSAASARVEGVMNAAERLDDFGAMAQLEYRPWPIASFTLGVRSDRRDTDISEPEGSISPRFGAVLRPDPLTSVRLLVSRGFRSPSIAELSASRDEGDIIVRPNPAIGPETAWSGEVGVNRVLFGFAAVDVGLFETRYRDMIEPMVQDTTDPSTGSLLVKFENVVEARIRGIEATARVALLDNRLRGAVGYMYLDAENRSPGRLRTSAADSLRLPYRPRHVATIGIEGDLGGVFAGYDYRYVGSYPYAIYPNDPRGPRITSDVRLGVRLGRFRVTGTVTNLFNYVYAERERKLSGPRVFTLALDARL